MSHSNLPDEIIYRRTNDALEGWERLMSKDEPSRLQLLYDLSTWECNKPIIKYMFKHPSEIDTRSDRRANILLPLGTMIEFYTHHDKHNYPVPSRACVCNHGVWGKGESGKVYMTAITEEGAVGSLLYIYNPYDPVFAPVAMTKREIVGFLDTALMRAGSMVELTTALTRIKNWKGFEYETALA